jgi:hypothetical protein
MSPTATSAPAALQRRLAGAPVDPDHQSEVPSPAGGDPGDRILDHRRLLRFRRQQRGSAEIGVGRRLAGQPLALQIVAVDDGIEQAGKLGPLEHRAAVVRR